MTKIEECHIEPVEMLLKTIFPMSSTLVYLERRRKAQTDN
jgi:hypothetical protein